MTLAADAERNRLALVAQLYDQWNGYYMIVQLRDGAWYDVRPLARDEAMAYRCRPDEALRVAWTQEH